jgi:hypothetical protein
LRLVTLSHPRPAGDGDLRGAGVPRGLETLAFGCFRLRAGAARCLIIGILKRARLSGTAEERV